VSGQKALAYLNEPSGRRHPLQAAATRIGRLSDNDVILDSPNVSRHHAVIVDTGTNYIINDLRSSNGVQVQHQRIRATATLHDGDHIRICDHEFTFQVTGGEG
jgi:pSer/pThr/pTyr-binding forkhead associated (FHA) protein